MGEVEVTLGLSLGAFLLACWLDAKIGDSRPGSPARRIVHVVVGILLVQASAGALYLVEAAGASQAAFMLAVLGLFVPALVYALLAGMWLIRTLVEMARFAGR